MEILVFIEERFEVYKLINLTYLNCLKDFSNIFSPISLLKTPIYINWNLKIFLLFDLWQKKQVHTNSIFCVLQQRRQYLKIFFVETTQIEFNALPNVEKNTKFDRQASTTSAIRFRLAKELKKLCDYTKQTCMYL